MGNLRDMPVGTQNEIIACTENLKRNIANFSDHAKVIAKIRKNSYDAHIKEGFTPDQALELCKSMLL